MASVALFSCCKGVNGQFGHFMWNLSRSLNPLERFSQYPMGSDL